MKPNKNAHNTLFETRTPILVALTSLLISGVITSLAGAVYIHLSGARPSMFLFCGGAGIIAAVIGFSLGLAKWWIPILIVFPYALAASLQFNIPPWIYLICFLALLVVFWNAAGDRVPLYLTNQSTTAVLDKLITVETKTFADIGCGVGGILTYLARRHPNIQFSGIETAPIPYLISNLRVRLMGYRNVSIHFQSMWDANLQDYDIVYCFLSPEPMSRIYDKVEHEMRPGSRFISNSFIVENVNPDDVVEVGDARQTKLFIWQR